MTKNPTALYLDDVRIPTEQFKGYQPWGVVKNYEEFVQWIETHGIPDFVSLDHDLADEHMADYFANQAQGNPTVHYDQFKEKTGVDCLNYLLDKVQQRLDAKQDPVLTTINIHSHNPVGAGNMYHKAENFKKHTEWKGHVILFRIPFFIPTKVEEN